MLLNIVDYDPRSKKRVKPTERAASIPVAVSDQQEAQLEAKLKKRKLVPSAQAGSASPAKAAAKRSKLISGTSNAGASTEVSKAPAVSNQPQLLQHQQQQQKRPLQQKHHRRQAHAPPADSGSDGPDWASVEDCLLEEVEDAEKLFREQLDMDTPTADSERVFSRFAIKDCKDIHPYLVSLLTDKLGLQFFTKVQAETLPLVLAGKDVLVKTQTGSGKSLALLLPLVQLLQSVQPPITRSSGVQALVLCPTHELAEQSHHLLEQLLRPFVRIVSGQLVGGVKRKSQKASLRRGLNILVATPRRLLDHLEKSSRLDLCSGMRMLIVDEADRLAEMGYEKDVRRIVEAVCAGGRRPQTLLCSATLSDGAERLAGLALAEPSSVSEEEALPASVRHHVMAAPTKARLRALLAVVRALLSAGHKAAVFLPTQASVDFHHALLTALLSDSVPLCRLHGNLSHADRIRSFREFAVSSGCGLLITTDVSARGLDLSRLGWVIQGPGEPQIYCHRAGRTARLGRPGRSLLLLDSGEAAPFLRLLASSPASRGIRFAPVPPGRLLARWCPENFQHLAEELTDLAEDAFLSTVRARASFTGELRGLPMPHTGHLADSFCLRDPPGVIAANVRRRRHGQAGADGGTGAGERTGAIAGAGGGRRTSKVAAGKRVRTGPTDRMSEFASGI